MGDVELLSYLGAERLALPEEERYLTFYVTCTDATRTFDDLLQALVNAAESVENAPAADSSRSARQLVDRTTRKKLTLKIVELESTKKYETESQRLSYQDLNLEEKLVQLCEILSSAYGQPVLFIIDELDRLQNTHGLASFLKAVSSDFLKFVLVGIASNVADLLADHRSLDRRLVPVRVPVMNPRELAQIVLKAEAYLESEGANFHFSDDAKVLLARTAAGFPWFVHVLGQQALSDADARGASVISAENIADCISGIVANRFAQQFSDTYQQAVRDSRTREIVLRAMAGWHDADIPTGEIYRFVESKFGITSPSTYRSHLCSERHGAVISTTAIQKRGLVRFRNEMFKAYVRLRPSIYEGVDEAVRLAWQHR